MSDVDGRLWRVADRGVLILVVGVLGLLVGLGPQPRRFDSLYGVIIVLAVTLPALVAVLRLPAPARSAFRHLPRRRPLLTATAALAGAATALVACWSILNALLAGTFSPLALALVAAVAAGITALLGRASRRLRAGVAATPGANRFRRNAPSGRGGREPGVRRDGR